MTDIEAVRLLVKSPDDAGEFEDSDIQAFLDLNGGSILLAAALALDTRAAGISLNAQEVRIGDFQTYDRTRLQIMLQQAAAFRDLEYNTPACGFAELDLSDMNAIEIITNFVYRNEGGI